MTPVERFAVWCAGIILGLITVVVLAGTLAGTLAPAVALGILGPAFGALATGVVMKANSDNDKDSK